MRCRATDRNSGIWQRLIWRQSSIIYCVFIGLRAVFNLVRWRPTPAAVVAMLMDTDSRNIRSLAVVDSRNIYRQTRAPALWHCDVTPSLLLWPHTSTKSLPAAAAAGHFRLTVMTSFLQLYMASQKVFPTVYQSRQFL